MNQKKRLTKNDYPTIALALQQYHRELIGKPSTQSLKFLIADLEELFHYFNDKSEEHNQI